MCELWSELRRAARSCKPRAAEACNKRMFSAVLYVRSQRPDYHHGSGRIAGSASYKVIRPLNPASGISIHIQYKHDGALNSPLIREV